MSSCHGSTHLLIMWLPPKWKVIPGHTNICDVTHFSWPLVTLLSATTIPASLRFFSSDFLKLFLATTCRVNHSMQVGGVTWMSLSDHWSNAAADQWGWPKCPNIVLTPSDPTGPETCLSVRNTWTLVSCRTHRQQHGHLHSYTMAGDWRHNVRRWPVEWPAPDMELTWPDLHCWRLL